MSSVQGQPGRVFISLKAIDLYLSPLPSLAGTLCTVKLSTYHSLFMPAWLMVLLSGNLDGSVGESFANTGGFNLSREVCRDREYKSYLVWELFPRAFCIPSILCLLLLFNVASAIGTLSVPMSEGGLEAVLLPLLLL